MTIHDEVPSQTERQWTDYVEREHRNSKFLSRQECLQADQVMAGQCPIFKTVMYCIVCCTCKSKDFSKAHRCQSRYTGRNCLYWCRHDLAEMCPGDLVSSCAWSNHIIKLPVSTKWPLFDQNTFQFHNLCKQRKVNLPLIAFLRCEHVKKSHYGFITACVKLRVWQWEMILLVTTKLEKRWQSFHEHRLSYSPETAHQMGECLGLL